MHTHGFKVPSANIFLSNTGINILAKAGANLVPVAIPNFCQ